MVAYFMCNHISLRILLRLRKACETNGQQLTLVGVNENVMEVLQITHFDNMFIIK